jgi:hypothetical protein
MALMLGAAMLTMGDSLRVSGWVAMGGRGAVIPVPLAIRVGVGVAGTMPALATAAPPE